MDANVDISVVIATVDYGIIYTFLAGLFDPNQTDHEQKLAGMAAVDREAAQILMHNLAVNLTNKSYTDSHQLLVSQRQHIAQIRSSPGTIHSPTVPVTELPDSFETTNNPAIDILEEVKQECRSQQPEFSDVSFLLEPPEE